MGCLGIDRMTSNINLNCYGHTHLVVCVISNFIVLLFRCLINSHCSSSKVQAFSFEPHVSHFKNSVFHSHLLGVQVSLLLLKKSVD